MSIQRPEEVPAERWAEAALWREHAVARLEEIRDELELAIDGMPISSERVIAKRAARELADALRQARLGATTCRAREAAART